MIVWPVAAEEKPDAANYVEVGLHGNDISGNQSRVSEYNQARDRVEGTLQLRLMNEKDDLKYKLDLSIFSNDDMKLDLVINKGHWFTSTTTYNKFMHKMGHDYLTNMVYRETVNPDTNQPGGKMATYYDHNPSVDYFKVYEDLQQVFNIQLNTEMESDLELGFRAQTRTGVHQTMQLSHCDNCHVQTMAADLDQVNYDAWVKVHAKVNNRFDVSYKFTYSKFENDADPTMYAIDLPRHPANGGNVEEFGSRQVFGGEDVVSGYVNDNERASHEVRVEGQVTDVDRIVGNASYSKVKNKGANLNLTTTAGSFRWSHKYNNQFRMDALFSYYKMDNDDIMIDLPAWRDGRGGGGQDFDWMRYSAYDRNVSLLKFKGYYKKDNNNRFTFTARYEQVDRENTMVTFDQETETVETELKVRWDGRYGDLRAMLEASYETIDNPFANAAGIIEPSLGTTLTPIDGNTFVYYWQRYRIGEATNLPSTDMNLRGNLSYKVSDRVSVSANLNYRDGSNDDLNYYEFDVEALNAGLNLFAVLNDKAVMNFGFNHSNMETQAFFSVPVFDG